MKVHLYQPVAKCESDTMPSGTAMRRFDNDRVELFESNEVQDMADRARTLYLIKVGVASLLVVSLFIMTMATLISVSKTSTATKDIKDQLKKMADNNVAPVIPPCEEACLVSIEETDRIDCHPDKDFTKESCTLRGCCYNETRSNTNVPVCYFPEAYSGYKVQDIVEGDDKTVILLERVTPSGIAKEVKHVRVEITSLDENRVRIKLDDAENNRWEVPIPILNNAPSMVKTSRKYRVESGNDGVLKVIRVSTGTQIINMDLKRLIYADQLLQVTNVLPNSYLLGLGEHKAPFRKEVTWKTYTMFNSDRSPTRDAPLYGTQPYYMMVEDTDANTHGVLFFNNNIMDVILTPQPSVTYRTIGGVLDFYVYLGPSPQDVTRQHVSTLGRPPMPPLWALGFHLCRYGYGSDQETRKTWQRMRDAKIPFDAQWNDIDYMDKFNDFTYDKKSFEDLPELVKDIHAVNMKWVPIIDPAVSGSENKSTYPPYDLGDAMGIFVKDDKGEKNFFGRVWNTKSSVWPDFSHPDATAYWTKMFQDFYDQVPFDGAWIDMNEPSNVFDGQEGGCPVSDLENPPYVPGGGKQSLQYRTICMSATQYLSHHYDLHNMYAIFEAKATREALIAVRNNKRPFIISRASSSGFGAYASHWTGDEWSTEDDMKFSIPSILNFNMFGVPLVGADICGFGGNTTVELCARWSTLGAFYPFSRNHNTIDAAEQDPPFLGPQVVAAAKGALEMRYSLLPYLYTLFSKATMVGDTVMRPLMFEFPTDQQTYQVEEQFMLGPSVLVSPILALGTTSVEAYFPAGKWYDFEYNTLLVDSKGETKILEVPREKISVSIRGGSVVPMQKPEVTTTDQRQNPFQLLVALDASYKATGQLYWDDGDDIYSMQRLKYSLITFKNALTSKPEMGNYKDKNFVISTVTILGLSGNPSKVLVDGTAAVTSFDQKGVLSITSVNLDINKEFVISWSF